MDPVTPRRKRPYYKRFPSDWLAGTAGLTAEQKGVYDTVLELLYDRGEPIKDEPRELARITGCSSTRRYSLIRDQLVAAGKLQLVDGYLTNPRWERQYDVEQQEAEVLGQNGSKVRKDSRKNTPQNSPGLFDNNDLTKKGFEPNQSPESRVHESSTHGRRKAPRRTMPEGWTPGEREVAYASKVGITGSKLDVETTKFVRHHLSRGTLIANMYATWQTWIDNAIQFAAEKRARATAAAGQPSILDVAFGHHLDGGNT